MRRPLEILAEEKSMRTIVSLTGAFEGLASMKIMQTKNHVLKSNEFFNEVWNIYKQIRIDPVFNFGRERDQRPINRELVIIITASGGLSGDIDQRLLRHVDEYYDKEKHDLVVIGHHGQLKLQQSGVEYKQYFNLPKKETFSVDPLMAMVQKYKSTRVFYESYASLTVQDIKSLDLSEIVATKGAIADRGAKSKDVISEKNYIFEPSPYVVTAHLETSMLRLALTQLIYDSRLAQTASRFRAMSAAKEKANETVGTLHTQYNRAKRAVVDQRLKEIIAGLKKIRQAKEAR